MKLLHQEGIARLWRGTNAGLALAVPTVSIFLIRGVCFNGENIRSTKLENILKISCKTEVGLILPQVAIYLPFYDVFRNHLEEFTSQNAPGLTPYVPLVAGSLSRSLACTSCYPIELARTRMQVFSLISSMFYICWVCYCFLFISIF